MNIQKEINMLADQIKGLTAVPLSKKSNFINPASAHLAGLDSIHSSVSGLSDVTYGLSAGIKSHLDSFTTGYSGFQAGIKAGTIVKMESLSKDIPIISAATKAKTVIASADGTTSTSICDLYDAALGSIKNMQGFISDVEDQVLGVMGEVLGQIGNLINMAVAELLVFEKKLQDAIASALKIFTDKLAAFMKLIDDEIALIASWVDEIVGLGFLKLLDGLDPCLLTFMSSITKAGSLDTSSLPKF